MAAVDVIVNSLKQADGRDKFIKIVQYTVKLCIWKEYFSPNTRQNLTETAIKLSTARSLLRFGNWVQTLQHIEEETTNKKRRIIRCLYLVSVLSTECFDDVYCLGRLDAISPKLRGYAGEKASLFWFICMLFEIRWTTAKLSSQKLSKKEELLERITLVKLCIDMAFVSEDVFHLRVSKGYQTVLGIISGILGIGKMYLRQVDLIKQKR
jgi:hypothetical protein